MVIMPLYGHNNLISICKLDVICINSESRHVIVTGMMVDQINFAGKEAAEVDGTEGSKYQDDNLYSTYFTHYCDPDTFTGRFCINDQDHFTTLWKVRGPDKSYKIYTKFTRRE